MAATCGNAYVYEKLLKEFYLAASILTGYAGNYSLVQSESIATTQQITVRFRLCDQNMYEYRCLTTHSVSVKFTAESNEASLT